MQLEESITILIDAIEDEHSISQLLSETPKRFHWVSRPVEQPTIDVILLSAPDELHVIEQRLEHLQHLYPQCPKQGIQDCLAYHHVHTEELLRAIDYALARHHWGHLVTSELRLLHRVIQSSESQ